MLLHGESHAHTHTPPQGRVAQDVSKILVVNGGDNIGAQAHASVHRYRRDTSPQSKGAPADVSGFLFAFCMPRDVSMIAGDRQQVHSHKICPKLQSSATIKQPIGSAQMSTTST